MDLEAFLVTGRKQLKSVQRERLNDSAPRWWRCESLDIFKDESRNQWPSEGDGLGSIPRRGSI
jgi:hypothetical protein